MIIVKLVGGLGNQMFQYAIGKHLSILHKTTLKIDKGILGNAVQKGVTPRNLDLQLLNTEILLASEDEIKPYTTIGSNRYLRWFMRFFPFFFHKAFISESGHTFHSNYRLYPSHSYLLGFWHCERYFSPIREILLQEFTPKATLSNINQQLLEVILSTQSVSIHIRRGDYVTNPQATQFHGILDESYYRNAIAVIEKKFKNLHLYIFSDDIEWVKNHFSFSHPVTFIDHNSGDNAVFDLFLMSQCHHQIIANSTFSWWGAWLNNHSDKIVIAPRKWLNSESITWQDVYPKSWLVI